MVTEKTIKLYTFDELTGAAKERARQWWLECRDASDFDSVIEDFATICEMIGVYLKKRSFQTVGGQTRYEPDISWSLGYCQGDFAAFDGEYSYAKGGLAKLKAYAPQDQTLHAIAETLQQVQARYFYSVTASIAYHTYYGLQVETESERGTLSDSDTGLVRECMRDLAGWLYRSLRAEDEYMSSDEQVAEAMEANGYTFREDGRRED